MKATVLNIDKDGNQALEEVDVPDNWFDAPPQPIDPVTMTQLAVAELAQAVEDNNTATQLAIAELAEALLGG